MKEWLASRIPSPPEVLAAQLDNVAGDMVCSTAAELADILLTAAERILLGIGDDRSSAHHLLAADALISYAIEAASESCDTVEVFASLAIKRIAGVSSRGEQSE